MWEPLARALGYPKQEIGFGRVLQLAQDPKGLAKLGRPEYGSFRLGHTKPDFSTSGLSALAAEYYSATGKEGLTVEDVEQPNVRAQIRAIERSIFDYGDTTLFFSDQLKRYGPAYASAVAMEEATLVDFNRTHGNATKLVGIYPKEGTFFSDNPLIVPTAPWVTPELKQPTRVLSLPQPDVVARVKAAWREDRKPANVMLAVDVSGSMSEEQKLDQANEGLKGFFRQLSARDRVGLIFFNDKVYRGVPVQSFAKNRQELRDRVRDLLPGGETAWIDAAGQALGDVQQLRDPTRINAVVLLTDGADTASSTQQAQLEQLLDGQARNEGSTVRLYTIAYGRKANKTALEAVARASGGKAFSGDPKQIESVYLSISSFF